MATRRDGNTPPYPDGRTNVMPALFGYVGPEVMMPLASVAAAIGGAVMLFGRRMLYMFKKGVRAIASVVRRD